MRKALAVTAFAAGWSMLVQSAEPPHVATSAHKSPAEELASFKLPPGFVAQLVASEPDIQKPMNMAFDVRGRLWITDSAEYPIPAAEGKGRDTIKILSDFGPDGKARKIETFVDKLNIPIGILPYADGCIAYSIPNVWMFRDTDGDGKADKREILISGFEYGDTHGMVSSMALGLDGWVYANHGYANTSNAKGRDGSQITMNSGHCFRFKPDGTKLEIYTHGQVNPFGRTFDEYGDQYTACCHSKPINLLLRGAYYPSFGKPHDGLGFAPEVLKDYNGSTALCGLAYYQAPLYPEEYQRNFFLGDVVNCRINRFTSKRVGAGIECKQVGDFLTSTDPWFRPVDIKLGPDGALYVADFYNRIIGHYEVDLKHPGRDRTSGRIWRIVRDGKNPDSAPDFAKVTMPTLVLALGDQNIAIRHLATYALLSRLKAGEEGPSRRDLTLTSAANFENHVSWAAEHRDNLQTLQIERLLLFPDKLIQANAARILGSRDRWTNADRSLALNYLEKSDGMSKRNMLDALGAHPEDGPNTLRLLMAQYESCVKDPFLLHTVRMAIRDNLAMRNDNPELWTAKPEDAAIVADVSLGIPSRRGANLLLAAIAGKQPSSDQLHHLARFAADSEIDRLAEKLPTYAPGDPVAAYRLWQAFRQGLQARGAKLPPVAKRWTDMLGQLLLSAKEPDRVHCGIELTAAEPSPPLCEQLDGICCDKDRPANLRSEAVTALIAAGRPARAIAIIADANSPKPLQDAAAKALGTANRDDTRSALLAALAVAPAKQASVIATALALTPAGSESLLTAVKEGKASPRLLQEKPVVARMNAARVTNLDKRIVALTEGLPAADELTDKLIAQRRTSFLAAKTDLVQGEALYKKHCANCHQIANQGAKVGPQLDGIGVRGIDRLLEDILDPNRNIDPAFRSTTLDLADGRVMTGLVLRDEGRVIVIANSQGQEETVSGGAVTERRVSPISPMPADFATQITEAEFNNLLAWLLSQKPAERKP